MSYRLLIPTVRPPIVPSPPSPSSPSPTTRSPRLKPTPARLIRSRSGSASLQSSPDPAVISQPPPNVAEVWLGKPFKFDIVQDTFELEGYQMYAVEKWVVERTRAITVLTVYTGNPQHKITVTVLSPSQSLLPPDAGVEWNNALHHLRRDGARPKQTPHGVLMVTSLANFRSDYTIVQIPNGDFLAAKERLYTNINLSRMGCSGRSALTLEEPSETTKERFRSAYLLPDSPASTTPFRPKTQSLSHARAHSHPASPAIPASSPSASVSPSTPPAPFTPPAPTFTSSLQSPTSSPQTTRPRNPFFNATVLELVKLVQAALAICGMFPLAGLVNVSSSGQGGTPPSLTICELDGLLCDVTVEGLQRWVAEIGEPCVGIEPMERVADPTTICALLSLVLVSRNKLATISSSSPKDPFLYPHAFIGALNGWAPTHMNGNTGSGSGLHFPHGPSSFSPTHSPRASLSVSASHVQNSPTQSTASNATSNATSNASNTNVYLTQAIYSALCVAHDHKVRHAGRRAILSKLDDFTTGLRNDSSEESGVESASESEPVSGGMSRRGTRSTSGSGRGIGGRGGQLLMSGIENLASGFVGRVSNSGPATVTSPSLDLGTFIKAVVGRSGDKDRADREREKDREKDRGGDKRGVWDGEAPGVASVGGVAGSLRGLWSGRVEGVVRLRNKIEGRQHDPGKNHDTAKPQHHDKHHDKDKGRKNIYSDPEDGGLLTVGERTDGGKSGSTETEDEFAFGGAWSGRVQKKLDLWTRINRSKRSVDLSTTTNYIGPLPKGRSTGGIMVSAESSSSGMFPVVTSGSNTFSGTKQQVHPAVVVSGETGEEEELLSSGQVSPISASRTHNPFTLGLDSAETSSVALDRFAGGSDQPYQDRQTNELSEHDKRLHAFLMRRPGLGGRGRERESRISSWSDPVSAQEGERGKMADDYDDEMEGIIDEGIESEGDADVEAKKRVWKRSIQRRHSFHDIKSFRDVNVLKPEWMRIDVELCGQLLVMRRRDTHLQSVLACLEHITDSLSSTNASLRSDYHSHHSLLTALASHTQLLSQIESARGPADAMAQQVQALIYESHQFRVDELWHSAAPSREKVLSLREKVFGMGAGLGQGGRRYVKGGKGRYNRVQWTLDGQERMVDAWGRTESEGEEEKRAGFGMDGGTEDEEASVEEEGEAVEHTVMKPVWLLRFFTSWGARWGSSAWKGAGKQPANDAPSPSPSASTST